VTPDRPLAEFRAVLAEDPLDLARGALAIARLEYPDLRAAQSLGELDRLGARAASRLHRLAEASARERVRALNHLLFEEEGFAGNHEHYGDFRNSCLNVVLDRRLGIPITLALVYMEVARRSGLVVNGIGFPGHFLMQVPDGDRALVLDPFDRGAELDEPGCRRILERHLGDGHLDLDRPLAAGLLDPCTPRHLLARMLNNLKRTYIETQSFPQARRVSTLLLAAEPTLVSELRDRGLLAYHLNDFSSALRDLESYLRLSPAGESDDAEQEERSKMWEHVKTLRRRVATLN
jgi:regulator of sirC expression with transglutaminase-like and TPR domain